MSLSFHHALGLVLAFEGAFTSDPDDPGGPTKWGVTQETYNGYRLEKRRVEQSVQAMTRDECTEIYETQYWYPCHGDELTMNLAAVHFDTFVNLPPGAAFRCLQLAANGGCRVDGKWGPQTKAAVTRAIHDRGEKNVIENYLRARAAYYAARVQKDPVLTKYIHGWMNRVNRLAAMYGITTSLLA
jgi:lysozyme family protein